MITVAHPHTHPITHPSTLTDTHTDRLDLADLAQVKIAITWLRKFKSKTTLSLQSVRESKNVLSRTRLK